jgi:ribosome biogenesis GTPase / thiamine phosphate phosphatase
MSRSGLVVASFGRHCMVESEDGTRTLCHPRGKKSQVVVGDHVQWLPSTDEGTIEKVNPRRNLLYRQDEVRTKEFAANLDQVLVLIAAEPEFSEHQLTRALIACEAAKIKAIIALNKSDLPEPFELAWQRLAPYRHMHYGVLPLSLRLSSDVDKAHLIKHLQGKTTLILGPSGSGKSTLINLLAPGARVLTNEISQALNSGKHTTTSTTLYWVGDSALPASTASHVANNASGGAVGPEQPGVGSAAAAARTALIDSPGFQEFGLHHIEPTGLASLMPDISAHLGNCKFYNCTHLHEPGCGVIAAVKAAPEADDICARRYKLYGELFAELSAPPEY